MKSSRPHKTLYHQTKQIFNREKGEKSQKVSIDFYIGVPALYRLSRRSKNSEGNVADILGWWGKSTKGFSGWRWGKRRSRCWWCGYKGRCISGSQSSLCKCPGVQFLSGSKWCGGEGRGEGGILVEEVLWMMGEPAKCMQGEVLSWTENVLWKRSRAWRSNSVTT